MSDPLGFNPVGDHAPGLPQHDRGLPGHVSGTDATPAFGDFTSDALRGYGVNNAALPPTYAETVLGKWAARAFTLGVILFTLPIQMALYPIAGIAAFAAGGCLYLLLHGAPMDREAILSWVWYGAFAGFLPVMRFENDITDRMPKYRISKHALRLILIALVVFYYDLYSDGDAPPTAAILAVIVAALAHFVLRWGLTMGLWRALLHVTWLRSTD